MIAVMKADCICISTKKTNANPRPYKNAYTFIFMWAVPKVLMYDACKFVRQGQAQGTFFRVVRH